MKFDIWVENDKKKIQLNFLRTTESINSIIPVIYHEVQYKMYRNKNFTGSL